MKNKLLIKINHDERLFRRKVLFRRNKKAKNRAMLGIKRQEHRYKATNNQYDFLDKPCKHLVPPSNFSLLENTEEVISFINKVDECYNKKRKIFIVMTNVENIASGAIVVLLSKLVQFKTEGIYVNGNFPKNNKARKVLTESGFIEYLYKKTDNKKDEYIFDNKICTHANRIVDPILSAEIIKNASKMLWGDERRCLGVQRVFIELMQNTNNHASDIQGEKHWWTSIAYVKRDDKIKVCFSFIDYGAGIFTSLSNKRDGKFVGIVDRIKNRLEGINNAKLLEMLLHGEIHKIAEKTQTNKPYRGKGLPGILKALEKNDISNLQIISNDAYANVEEERYVKLNNELNGTYVYWELNTNNNNINN